MKAEEKDEDRKGEGGGLKMAEARRYVGCTAEHGTQGKL